MIPSPVEITYFQEIAQAESFSRAANKLSISQPSLSIAMKRLEKTIGADLFVRHKRGATLTPAGRSLFVQTKVLLDNWDNIRLDAVASHQQVKGELKLGCHPTVALYLRGFLPKLLVDYPQLSFSLIHDISPNITEQVINSQIDIAIVSNPFKHPDLIIKKIKDTETTFWKAKGWHPTQDIHSDRLVVICDPAMPRTATLLKQWDNEHLKSARMLTSNQLEIVANLTAAGCGVGILPSCFAQLIYPGLLEVIPNAPVSHDELYLIYRKENRNVKAVVTVITAIKQFIEAIKNGKTTLCQESSFAAF